MKIKNGGEPSVGLPRVVTGIPTDITPSTARFFGEVTADGSAQVPERGFVFSSEAPPPKTDREVIVGAGADKFQAEVLDLSADTTYYVRTYATNSEGTAYGEVRVLQTLPTPVKTVS